MLGKEVNIPATLMFNFPEVSGNGGVGVNEYVSELQGQMLRAHDIARDNLKTSQKKEAQL
jgi:hypothetical protein